MFIWLKYILFEFNKCYSIQLNLILETKKAFQTNYFLSFNQIFFMRVDDLILTLDQRVF